jgi:hypothetical protein
MALRHYRQTKRLCGMFDLPHHPPGVGQAHVGVGVANFKKENHYARSETGNRKAKAENAVARRLQTAPD